MNGALLRSCVKQLAWAENEQPLLEVGECLRQQLGCGELGVYLLDAQRQLRRVVYAKDSDGKTSDDHQFSGRNDPANLPREISGDSPLYRQLIESSESVPRRLSYDGARRECPAFLPLLHQGRQEGVVILSTDCLQSLQHSAHAVATLGTQIVLTARRLAQQTRLHGYGRTLDQLMEHTQEAFCQWSRDKGWEYHNLHLLYRIGHQPSQLPLLNVFGHPRVVVGREWRTLNRLLDDCINKGRDLECEYQVRAPNEFHHTFRTRLRVLEKDDQGRVQSIAGISVDITDSRRMEAEARAHAELEEWLLERNSRLFDRCDGEAVVETLTALGERLNLARCYIRRYPDEEDPVYAQWQAPGIVPITEVHTTLLSVKPLTALAHYVTDIEKESFYEPLLEGARQAKIRAQMTLPMLHEGVLHGYLVCQNTIPREWSSLDRRAALILAEALCMVLVKESIHQKLIASQERFQLAMEAASYGLWEFNIPEQTIFCSPSFYTMLGAEPRPGFNPLDLDHVHKDDRRQILDHARALKDGSVDEFFFESRHFSGDGKVIWMLVRGRTIMWDDTGKPLRAMGTIMDISHLKNIQAGLQLARQEAESAHLAKSEFLARMSHEIRTPMNAIIGMAYLALQSDLDEQQRAYITDVDKAAKALLRIIDDILDFSKIEADKLVLENCTFDLRAHLQEIAAEFEPEARTRKLDFRVVVDQSTPQWVQSDPSRLRQVLMNLLSNAFKFTRAGKVALSVKAQSTATDFVELGFTVSDTGIGMAADQIDHLFDPFTQADSSATRQYGGTGLGLAISKQLVKMMGGDISVDSEPDEGSSFKFSIVCQRAAASAFPDGRESDSEPDTGTLQGARVLLVDDNEVNRKVAAGLLKRRDVQVTFASDGREALTRIKQSASDPFDAILMDIEMPSMDGLEATRAIRDMGYNNTPIIAMTAHDVDEDRQRYLDAGMDECISKPFRPDSLYEILEHFLTHRHRPPVASQRL